MAQIALTCFACGFENSLPDRVGMRDECDKCGADLHCCRCCRFFDPGSYNQCKEPSAELVREKDRRNLCDYFFPATAKSTEDPAAALKRAAEALFKKT